MATTNTRIVIRRDTSGRWTQFNPALLVGEQGWETDTGKIKIGTGAQWDDTPYAFASAAELDAEEQSRTSADAVLQGEIQALATKSADDDAAIIADLATETDERTAADALLTTELNTLAAKSAADDAVLTAGLATETDNRTNADSLLQDEITTLSAKVIADDNALGLRIDGAVSDAAAAQSTADVAEAKIDAAITGATGTFLYEGGVDVLVDNMLTGATGGDYVGTFTGPVTGNVTGDLTGNVIGALIAADGTVVANPGATGGDATFVGGTFTGTHTGVHTGVGQFTTVTVESGITGNLTGDTTGDHVGRVLASNRSSVVVNNGTDGSDAVFTGSLVGNADSATVAEGATGALSVSLEQAITDSADAVAKATAVETVIDDQTALGSTSTPTFDTVTATTGFLGDLTGNADTATSADAADSASGGLDTRIGDVETLAGNAAPQTALTAVTDKLGGLTGPNLAVGNNVAAGATGGDFVTAINALNAAVDALVGELKA